MIDVGAKNVYFACDECGICEQLERRLQVAHELGEDLQFDHCGCDKASSAPVSSIRRGRPGHSSSVFQTKWFVAAKTFLRKEPDIERSLTIGGRLIRR